MKSQAWSFSSPRHSARSRTALFVDGTNIPGPPYAGPAVKPILDTIQSPLDMKRLDMRQLKQVSFSIYTCTCLFSIYIVATILLWTHTHPCDGNSLLMN